MWKGVAYYAAGNFDAAIEQFSALEGPQALFNLGNAYAHKEQYEDAIASYEKALELQPDFEEARANRKLVEEILRKQEEKSFRPRRRDLTRNLGRMKSVLRTRNRRKNENLRRERSNFLRRRWTMRR